MTNSMAVGGGLLSACGLGLLALDAQSGGGHWDHVLWQLIGCVAGASCFAVFVRRAWRTDRDSVRASALFAGAVLVLPVGEVPGFGIDRSFLAEIIRFVAVIVVGTVVPWRASIRGNLPTKLDRWAVWLPTLVLTWCALCLGNLPVVFAIIVVTSIMLRVAGHRSGAWLQAVVAATVLLAFLVLPHPDRRARVAFSVGQLVTARPETAKRSAAGMMMRSRNTGAARRPALFDLPPRVVRHLVIASIVGYTGYPGATAVTVLFGVVGWAGFRRARDAATLEERVMVAGMTATLVVPAALHIVACLVFLAGHAGSLPFVSYGPGDLVLAWVALGFVAAGQRGAQGLYISPAYSPYN